MREVSNRVFMVFDAFLFFILTILVSLALGELWDRFIR